MNSFRFHLLFFVALLVIALFGSHAFGLVTDPTYDDLEGYALVQALIKDGKLDAAAQELKGKTLRTQDPDRYAWLQAQYFYAKGEWSRSIDEALRVRGEWQNEGRLVLARAQFQNKAFEACAKTYAQLPVSFLPLESDAVWKAECQKKSGRQDLAWGTFQTATQRWPTFSLFQERIAFQLENHLAESAYRDALEFLGRPGRPAPHYLNAAELFHQAGQRDAAIGILEVGRSFHPLQIDVNLTLSQLYFQKGWMGAAEEGFARAGRGEAKYNYHAAEINRQLQRYQRAQYFNGFVTDPKEKLKQKIATFVDTSNYPMIASLDSVIHLSPLKDDDEIRYAMAYSLVRLGQIDKPLNYLSKITRPELLEKTAVLRKALIECKENNGVCRM